MKIIVWISLLGLCCMTHKSAYTQSQSLKDSSGTRILIDKVDPFLDLYPAENDPNMSIILKHRIHFPELFVERFNGTQDFPVGSFLRDGPGIDPKVNWRYTDLASLFDASALSDTFMVLKFISHMVDSSLFLHPDDSLWLASIDAKVTFQGKLQDIRFGLRLEVLTGEIRVWNMFSVQAPFLEEWMYQKNEKRHFVSELNSAQHFKFFRELLQHDIGASHSLAHTAFKADLLTLFFSLANLQQIQFSHIEDISFHFLQLPGWRLVVKEFLHESPRSGWLIEELVPANSIEKQQYLQTYFGKFNE